jgi:hypothetical protein
MPPKMGWAFRRRDDKMAVYGNAHPVKHGLAGLFILAICASLVVTQSATLLDGPAPPVAARALALIVTAALACQFFVRLLLTRSELHLDAEQHILTFHSWPPWGRARHETLRAHHVRRAVLVRKYRGKPYKSLYLILNDNRVRPVDQGETQAQMDRLAAYVEKALGGRLLKIETGLGGPRFVKEPRSPGKTVYLDLRNRERRWVGSVWLLLGSVCALAGLVPLVVISFADGPAQAIHALLSKRQTSALALLWLVVAWIFALAAFRSGIEALRYLRLVELVIHHGGEGAGIRLRYLSWRGKSWEETLPAAGIVEVVNEGKRPRASKRPKHGFQTERVWLRRRDGQMLLVDRAEKWLNKSPDVPRAEQSLGDFAQALGKDLKVPVKQELMGWFGRWFG